MALGTTRIAHLSDVHMLAERAPDEGLGRDLVLRYLNFGRNLCTQERARSFANALREAHKHGADHVVISGDLTETGTSPEFERFAEVLLESPFPAHVITLVPGNHDAYSCPDAWTRALSGPLRPFRETSAHGPNAIVDRGNVKIVPLNVSLHQPITRSSGIFSERAAESLRAQLSDRAFQQVPVVLVQHHPPFAHRLGAWHWVDGLHGHERLSAVLEHAENVTVMHGHLHHTVDRPVAGRAQSFGAPAIADVHKGGARIRTYEVSSEVRCTGFLAC